MSARERYRTSQYKSPSKSPSKSPPKSTSKSTTSGGGGGGQNSNYNQYTAYTPAQVKSGKVKVAKDIAKDNVTAFKNLKYTGSNAPSILGKILDATGVSKNTFNTNLSLYKKSVMNKNGFKESEKDFKRYMAERGSGKIDAMGRTMQTGGGRADNKPTIIKKNIGGSTIQTTAPTEAEVSQSEAANADAAALKVKKRGRSASILTGPKGVTKMASNYSLGKKSLLGRV